MQRFLYAISFAFFFIVFNANSQGCSDAGFCTMGAMRPNQNFSKKINLKLRSVELSQYYGLTSFYLRILSYTADVNFGITNKLTVQIKLPYQFVFGFLTNTNGFGDISLSATYNIYSNEKYQINLSAGTKIPTGKANLSFEGRPLPMYYQTTLGSYDAIFGVSFITKNWLFATGYQQALNANGNQFLWGPWKNSAQEITAGKYPKSKELKRGTDVMLRIERNMRFSNWNLYAGLLGIYRITPDSFIDTDNRRKDIKTTDQLGTNNLALTFLAGGGYRFNTTSGIKLMLGYRLVDRKAEQTKGVIPIVIVLERNPDGLSRLLVTTISYEYRF